MRPVLHAAAFVVLVVVISLIYKLPARIVYQQFPNVSPVGLTGISGSVWSGHVDAIHTRQLALSNLDWQLSFWSLLIGDIDVQWSLADPSATLVGEASLSGEQLSMMNIKGQIDLAGLGQRLPAQPILLGGQVDLDIADMNIENAQLLNIVGQVAWKPARLLAPQNIELGEFKADLSSDTGRLLARLSDTGGAVELQGDFILSPQGAYNYVVAIAIRDTSVPGLLDGFNQLGKHDQNGVAKLRGNGRLF